MAEPDIVRLLDATGRRILRALQENARLSLSELGRRVNLSAPAVAERMRRMEEGGLITGYQARVGLERAGLPISAFIRLTVPANVYPQVIALAQSAPEVLECHHVSGGESFILRVAVATVGQLEALIARFSPYGPTSTAIVLSSPVAFKIVEPPTLR